MVKRLFAVILALCAALVAPQPASASDHATAFDESFMIRNRHTGRCLEANPLQYVIQPVVTNCYAGSWSLHRWRDNTWQLKKNGLPDVCLEDSFAAHLEIKSCNQSRGQSWYLSAPSEGTRLQNQHTHLYLEDSWTGGLRTRTNVNSNTVVWSIT